MNHYNVFLNCVVTVKVSDIQAPTTDEAVTAATNVMTREQLESIFARSITDKVQTFFADDIPTVMIDWHGTSSPAQGMKPLHTSWLRIDIPTDDADVFAAVEDVLRVFKEGSNPFTDEELCAKIMNLQEAYLALPPHFANAQGHADQTTTDEGEGGAA
jgi:hypothetical protein